MTRFSNDLPQPEPRGRTLLRRGLRGLAAAAASLIALLLLLAYWPEPPVPEAHRPPVPASYAETVARLQAGLGQASPEIEPACQDGLLLHGHRTERVFVLMHGFTNCPAQFRQFGELLFRRGHNVLIPRLPFHGERDRLTNDPARLTAPALLRAANEAVDHARSLGRRVTVVGLSINGTVAVSLAVHRDDLDQVVLLAPFLAPVGTPEWAVAPVARLVGRLPNSWQWWDPKTKDRGGNGYSYPRFSTHALAEVLRLSAEVLDQARASGPRCGSVLVVTTGADRNADAALTRTLVARWRRRRPEAVRTYEFPAAEHVDHDFIDPTSAVQRISLVYPKLLSLLHSGAP
jgi:carboxylesterase